MFHVPLAACRHQAGPAGAAGHLKLGILPGLFEALMPYETQWACAGTKLGLPELQLGILPGLF